MHVIDPEELARARAPASATLDFASGFPEDREILNQIAAFANGDGGRLLLGVSSRRSQTGAKRALAVPGIPGSGDTAVARIQGLLNRIQPGVPGIAIRKVGDYKRGPVIEIRIPSSDGAPHAVDGVFRVRRGIASEVITESEVRAVEERQKEMRGRLAMFISSRVTSVKNGSTRVSFGDDRPPLLVAHLIPRSSIVTRLDIDYDRLSAEQQYQLRPMRSQTHGGKFEQEGFVTREEGDVNDHPIFPPVGQLKIPPLDVDC